MTPKRIQRRRTKGWRMPENTKSVTRPGKWGNPFRIIPGSVSFPDAAAVVELYRELVTSWIGYSGNIYSYDFGRYGHYTTLDKELKGYNLACYCPLCEKHKDGRPYDEPCEDCPPCHADVLLELANGSADE